MRHLAFLASLTLITVSIPATALAPDIECYDSKVRAKPVAQLATAFPQPDDQGIIASSWPWFVDLEVRGVIEGEPVKGRIETLAVLHMAYPKKTLTLYLRRNSQGTFNILRWFDEDQIKRCKPGTEPAAPYIRPMPGETLDDIRREAEACWE